jgi:hypothetical protein
VLFPSGAMLVGTCVMIVIHAISAVMNDLGSWIVFVRLDRPPTAGDVELYRHDAAVRLSRLRKGDNFVDGTLRVPATVRQVFGLGT